MACGLPTGLVCRVVSDCEGTSRSTKPDLSLLFFDFPHVFHRCTLRCECGREPVVRLWVRELGIVAVIAAVSAVVVPRVVLPTSGLLHRRPRSANPEIHANSNAREVVAPHVPTPPLSDENPTELTSAPAPAHVARTARDGGTTVAASLPPGALVHRNGVWVADLQRLPSPRTLLAGTTFLPPGEGPQREGFYVLHTDRNGLLRSAGVHEGDVLVGVSGHPLHNPDDVLDAVSSLRNATRATFEFQRGMNRYSVPVEVLHRPVGMPILNLRCDVKCKFVTSYSR
jgi:hypothetical protein